jgi:hypothetical protein
VQGSLGRIRAGPGGAAADSGGAARSGGGFSSGGSGAGGTANISTHGVPMELISILIRRLYENNEKARINCAFVVDLFGFQRCILSLIKRFDLRSFFRGISAYHDSERMARVLGVRTELQFVSYFADCQNGQVEREREVIFITHHET